MVMGLAFLLVVSLTVTAAVTALGTAVGGAGVIMQLVSVLVSLAILSILFAALFKFLPDAKIAWRTVWVGAFTTAALFELGKFLLGLYLGQRKSGNSFGAASALAVILVWIYYAGVLVLLGAELTREWAAAHGHAIEPREGGVRVEREERTVPSTGEAGPATRAAARPLLLH